MLHTISIRGLIYRSPQYADALYASLREFTPALVANEVDFAFVANDPTEQLLEHLCQQGYPHVVQRNPVQSLTELAAAGFDGPEYIARAYQGWNTAIRHATGEIVVLVSSDMLFSPGWFEALVQQARPDVYAVSQLIEPPRPCGAGDIYRPYRHDFGRHPREFRRDEFLAEVERVRQPGQTRPGGAYTPCAVYKETLLRGGLFPEGNPRGWYGDQWYLRKLSTEFQVQHITALDSITYHFGEGEMDSEQYGYEP